jgi:hypothetical protein
MALKLARTASEVINPFRPCGGSREVEDFAVGLRIQRSASLEML